MSEVVRIPGPTFDVETETGRARSDDLSLSIRSPMSLEEAVLDLARAQPLGPDSAQLSIKPWYVCQSQRVSK